MKEFEPFGERVLVRRHAESSARDSSGLVMPDSGKERPQEGTVLSHGPNVKSTLNIGDHVFFTKFAGNEIHIEDETLQIMFESEILGRLVDVGQAAKETTSPYDVDICF